MRLWTLALLVLTAVPAQAEDGRLAGDEPFEAAALASRLSGQIVEFFDGSKSRYGTGGDYGYTYTDAGPVWSGDWRTEEGSRVCVDFDNGSARCDRFVRSGERVVLITSDGTRFPVRNRSVAPE